jgi:hypothetical protein
MKCPEVQTWLLTGRSGVPSARDVERHVEACADCRRLRERIAHLDHCLRADVPAVDLAVRDRLLERLPAAAVVPPPVSAPVRARSGGVWLRPALAAAACLLIGFLASYLLTRSPSPSVPAPSVAQADDHEELVARFLQRDLRLAQTNDPGEQVVVLSSMADDLRAEALRLAQAGRAEEVPLVAGLYSQLVRQGLVKRAQALPAEQQPQVVTPLIEQLRATERDVERTSASARPALADFLRPMGLAARDGVAILSGQQVPAATGDTRPLLATPGTPRALLGTLVVQGIRLVEEEDSLRRADCFSDVADHFLHALRLAEAQGDAERAGRLEQHLGTLMDQGISPNLTMPVETLDEQRLTEVERVVGRINGLMQALEKGLALPPAATPVTLPDGSREARLKELDRNLKELEKAVKKLQHEEKKHGPPPKDKDKGPPKGKGPPPGKGRPPFVDKKDDD